MPLVLLVYRECNGSNRVSTISKLQGALPRREVKIPSSLDTLTVKHPCFTRCEQGRKGATKSWGSMVFSAKTEGFSAILVLFLTKKSKRWSRHFKVVGAQPFKRPTPSVWSKAGWATHEKLFCSYWDQHTEGLHTICSIFLTHLSLKSSFVWVLMPFYHDMLSIFWP